MGSIFSKIVSYWQGQPQIESQPQPKPSRSRSQSKPKSKSQSKSKSRSQSKPKSKPQLTSQPKPKPKPKQQPKLQPKPQVSDSVQNYEIIDHNGTQCVKYDGLIYDTLSNKVTHPGPCLWQLLETHGISNLDLRSAAASASRRTKGRIEYNNPVYNTDLNILFEEINKLGYNIGYKLVEWQMGESVILESSEFKAGRAEIVLRLMLIGDKHGGHYIESEDYNHRHSRFSLSSSKESEDDSTSSKKSIDEDADFSDDVSLSSDSSSGDKKSDKQEESSISGLDKVRKAKSNVEMRGDDVRRRNKKPKVAHLVTRDEVIPEGRSEIVTPFGSAYVELLADGDRLIYARREDPSYTAPTYHAIANRLHELDNATAVAAVELMLEYLTLELLSTETQANAFTSLNARARLLQSKMPKGMHRLQKEMAAVLCGILMLCESCTVRNPTAGKWERSLLRNTLNKLRQGDPEAFKNGFDEYIPSRKGGRRLAQDIIKDQRWRGTSQGDFDDAKTKTDGLGGVISSDSDPGSEKSEDDTLIDKTEKKIENY